MSIYRLRTQMGHYFKWLLLLVVVPIFVIGGMFYFGGQTSSGPEGGRRGESDIIAVVNGVKLKRGDYEELWEQAKDQARESGITSALQYANLRVSLFQQMVNTQLVNDAARELDVDISNSAVDREVENFVTFYLKQSRRKVLGKITPEREALDPRSDREYISELERGGSSLKQEEEAARMRVPREQVRAQLAQIGISRALANRVRSVTENDVINSYKVYKIRQIVLRPGSLPQAQLAAKAAKIRTEALAGTDFAKLVRDNTTDETVRRTGGAAVLSFDTRFVFPQAVRDAVEKMKPGEVSKPIDTPSGIYVVKLESVENRLPRNLDFKAKEARRQEIKREREMMAQMEFQQQIQARQRVEISDPEFLAYWQMMKLASAAPSPQEYAKQLKMAIQALRKAEEVRPNNFVEIHLAVLLARDGQIGEAIRILYPMLEGKDACIEGADLRVLLGDWLLKTGQKGDRERAIQQYIEASEVAIRDPMIHRQLVTKFKQVGRSDLAAREEKWIADYEKRMKQVESLQKKQTPGQSPMPPAGR